MNIHSKHWFWLFICTWGIVWNAQEIFAQKNKKSKNNTEEIQNNASGANSSSEAEYYLIEGMKYFVLEKYEDALENFLKASAFSSENPSIDYKIAETYVKMDNLAKAEVYASKALEKEKENKYIYLLLAYIYEQQQKYREAATVFEQLINANDGEKEYYFDLAEMYLLQKDYTKALENYDKLETAFGLNENVIRKKQEIYLSLNQIDKAVEEGEKLIHASPQNVKYLISLAELLMNHGQASRALSLLESNTETDQADPQLALLLSRIYRSQGDTPKALNTLKPAFANPDLDPQLKIDLIVDFLQEGESNSVNGDLLDLLALITQVHPREAKAHIVYADLLLIRDEKDKALTHYLIATQLDGNAQSKVWQQILALEAQKYAIDSLVKHSEKALELYPNQALFWLYNGSGHLGKKNYEAALTAAEEGKRLAYNNPQLQDDFSVILGDAFNGLKQYAESDAAYETVLKNSPNHPQALNNYSYFLAMRQEKLSRAKELAERLNENYPDNPSFMDTYGWVLYKAKDYKKAEKYLEKAAQLSKRGGIVEHYGDLLFKLGDPENALRQWIRAKELGGTSPQIDKKITEKKLIE
ncbi:MAG: tetratricopeptide repeat protein [Microscillaceae bacterium]|nr:tetratricopeptide repeat protein [Microscillaceae bacterium]